jgi:hypothetical protein
LRSGWAPAAALLVALALPSSAAGSATAAGAQGDRPADARERGGLPRVVGRAKRPPTGFRLLGRQAIAIARRDSRVGEALTRFPGAVAVVYPRRPRRFTTFDEKVWQVYFRYPVSRSSDPRADVILAVVPDASGRVSEFYTGYKVAWSMARGYPDYFVGELDAAYVWLPFCTVFLLGLLDWRRPWRLVHLDLVVLLAFSVSYYFFARADVGVSVPLVYPTLLYVLVRMLWIGFRGRGPGLNPTVAVRWLAVGVVLLTAVRLGLNLFDSSVTDVGFASVLGADRAPAGLPLYGKDLKLPDFQAPPDTYGPAAYYLYVPFEQALPWSGKRDNLPAAHAGAIAFDLATIVLLYIAGRRLRPGPAGRALGVVLAFAWAAFPFTAFALDANVNDAMVGFLVLGSVLLVSSEAGRGALLGLASATKFGPLAMVPLLATCRGWSVRRIAVYGLGFALVVALVMTPTIIDPGLATFYDRTFGFQLNRYSPFSVWNQLEGAAWAQTVVKVAAACLALLVGLLPRRKSIWQVAALGAAVLIAAQLFAEHWFYFYIVWFLPLVLVALAAPRAAGRAQLSE